MDLYNIRKFIIGSVFVLNGLIAGWDPEVLTLTNPSVNPQKIQDQSFQQLEQSVCSYLQNSWCSQEKAKLILETVVLTQPKVSVEIGAFTGSSALPLLAGLKWLKSGHAYVIDAWSNAEAISGLKADDPNAKWWGSIDMRSIKKQCKNLISSWALDPYCSVVQASSQQAASKIGSIDFLHLDGNFSEEGALSDTLNYLPKVKSGGYILLSNLFMIVDSKPTKKKALWPIFDSCEIVAEIENGNVVLFRKK
ncbi:MAG: class I SAM-dependent methyltransferase [Verrucomicrobia bacterium]|nr:class I SAM-dependent methyltransferase [Verrucomicrobiota bacterium]